MNEGWRRKGGKLQEGNRWAGRLQGPGVAWEGSDPFSIDSYHVLKMGFPGGSDGKEPACNVGDLGSVPGLGRSLGEGNGYPLQHSGLENSMDKGAWWATVHGVSKSQT